MNQRVLIALLLLVTGTVAKFGDHPFGPLDYAFRAAMCNVVLAPTPIETLQLMGASKTCIASLSELKDLVESIIDGLSSFEDWWDGLDYGLLLDKNGWEEKATDFRQCIAVELDLMAGDYFDTDALKASIWDKVDGLVIKYRTGLGLAGCGSVQDFNVGAYLQCVKTYCVTGSGPS